MTNATKRKKRKKRLVVLAFFSIIVLAAFLRFYQLEITPGVDFDSAAYAERADIATFVIGRANAAIELMKENLSGPWRFTNPVREDLFLNNWTKTPIFFAAWIFGLVVLLYKTLYQKLNYQKLKIGKFLIITNIVLLFSLAILGKSLVTHYFTLMLPFAFLSVASFFGFAMERAMKKREKVTRIISKIIFTTFVLLPAAAVYRQETVKSPSGQTSVYSIYFV